MEAQEKAIEVVLVYLGEEISLYHRQRNGVSEEGTKFTPCSYCTQTRVSDKSASQRLDRYCGVVGNKERISVRCHIYLPCQSQLAKVYTVAREDAHDKQRKVQPTDCSNRLDCV